MKKFWKCGTSGKKMERADPRPPGTFFHAPPHRLHFLMQHSRPRLSPGGAVQIVAPLHHSPAPVKGPLFRITPSPDRTPVIYVHDCCDY